MISRLTFSRGLYKNRRLGNCGKLLEVENKPMKDRIKAILINDLTIKLFMTHDR